MGKQPEMNNLTDTTASKLHIQNIKNDCLHTDPSTATIFRLLLLEALLSLLISCNITSVLNWPELHVKGLFPGLRQSSSLKDLREEIQRQHLNSSTCHSGIVVQEYGPHRNNHLNHSSDLLPFHSVHLPEMKVLLKCH